MVSWRGRGSSLPSTGSIWLPQASAEESQASFSPTHKRLYIIVIIITVVVCWFCNNSLMLCVGSTKTAAWEQELTVGELLQRLHFKSYSPQFIKMYLVRVLNALIIESQNLGWKRPLRPSSPTQQCQAHQ